MGERRQGLGEIPGGSPLRQPGPKGTYTVPPPAHGQWLQPWGRGTNTSPPCHSTFRIGLRSHSY